MSPITISKSADTMTFKEIKDCLVVKTDMPKGANLILVIAKTPVTSTFSPATTTVPKLPEASTPKKVTPHGKRASNSETKNTRKHDTILKFVKGVIPNAVSHITIHGANAKDESFDDEVFTTAPSSPSISATSTASTSNTAEPAVTRFDPAKILTPRNLLQTRPLTSKRDRALTHEIIERVWGKKLNHETDRRTECMYIWVPGSTIPFWLAKVHRSRQQQNRDKTVNKPATFKPTTPKPATATNAKAFETIKAEAKGKDMRDMNRPWVSFMLTEHSRVSEIYNKAGDEWKAEQDAQAKERKPATDNGPMFIPKETFKLTYKKPEEETEAAPVRVSAIPPHLRNKAT